MRNDFDRRSVLFYGLSVDVEILNSFGKKLVCEIYIAVYQVMLRLKIK